MAVKIYRINPDPVVTFAATELKKYIRMMMPRGGGITPVYNPDAKDGFRLGLMSDFGIEPDVEDIYLDDVIYVKTDKEGGIIAGSNPRSVLQAVYRYLKANGCNWLFPGPDGEQIPTVDSLKPVDYLHKASCRYRGQCNEGTETQPLMMDAIDFTPKIGLNTFMIEFDIPKAYYARAYEHKYGKTYAESPLSNEQILKWKRECEVELQKRGLLYHDMGHGWTAEPFGFDSTDGWISKDVKLDPKAARHLAQINGVREFWGGVALNTNLCMSNPETRSIIANYIADYAEKQNNVDFLHVWLADGSNNHCECEECQKKVTSDWYVMMLNDIDAELTKRNLRTHIVFIAYVDTLWGPETEVIKNEKRFTMLFAPITRLYSETYLEDADEDAVKPYIRNKLPMPKGMSENLGYLKQWKKMWKGDVFCYEYHFWYAQYRDFGSMYLAKIIYDDVIGLKKHGLSGIVEDGSQRSFFPTGFQFYVYGETLYDNSKTFEQLKEEYFSSAFGENWRLAADYLQSISDALDFKHTKGEYESKYYNPELADSYQKAIEIADNFLPTILENRKPDDRTNYVSWDLLKWHVEFVKTVSRGFKAVCVGDEDGAVKAFTDLIGTMAPLELLRYNVYDHELAVRTLQRVLAPKGKSISYSDIFME